MLPLTLHALLALASAQAEPEVAIHDDGFVRGTLVVDASPDTVRRVLGDSVLLALASPEVRRASATPDGACDRVDLEVKGLFTPFAVQTLRCPTDDGWTETLTDAAMFSAWDSIWTVSTSPSGDTVVTCAVRTAIDLPVPTSLVQRRTARSVAASLEQVRAHVDAAARRAPPTALAADDLG